MQGKDVFKYLKAAPWADANEIAAFAAELGPLPPAEVAKVLAFVIERQRSQPEQHRVRLEAFAAIARRSVSPALFAPFARALSTPDPVLRTLLGELIPAVNDVSKHSVLCDVLGSADSGARTAAADILRKLGGPQALDYLTVAVKADDFHGRMEAISSLVPRAKHRALPLLVAVANKGNPRERAEAFRYAGNRELMGKDLAGAATLLTAALQDPHDRVVAEAIKGLARVSDERTFFGEAGRFSESPKPIVRQAFVEALRAFSSQRVVNLLARVRRRAPPFIRMMVVESLEMIGTDDVLPVLVESIRDRQIEIQNRAADALVELSKNGKVELARTVAWLLRSRDVNVRRVAVDVARRVGDSGTLVPNLLRFLRDEDWWVRERVMDALVAISGKRLTEHLVAYLDDESDIVRRFAVGSLRRLKDPRSLGALVRAARNDSDWWIREDAILTVGDLGDERAIPYLTKLLKNDVDVALPCIQALHKLGAKEGTELVADALRSGMEGLNTSGLRLAAIRYLMDLGDARHAPALVACEDDPDISVRDAIDQARAKWSVSAELQRMSEGQLPPLDKLLVRMATMGADDLILSANRVPMVKHLGKLTPLDDQTLSDEALKQMLYPILTKVHREQMETLSEVDCSHQVRTHDLRFRVNLFRQMTGVGAVFRIVRADIPKFEDLKLPPLVRTFADLKNGLVLVGGPTGSGKSTTLAALIDHINRTSARHIVTVEDPIEVVHTSKESLVNQRETGTHTRNFESALRSTVRQDPDVILVGEMRDLATVSFAVTAAETGHLVFGTVHTVSVDTSIDRILNTFPPGQRPQVRSMLSETLRAVICQHLLPKKGDSSRRMLAVELMLNVPAVANLIRKDKTYQIPAVLTTHREMGMQSMDQHLVELVKTDQVSYEDAYMRAQDKKQFEMLSKGELEAADQHVRGAPPTSRAVG